MTRNKESICGEQPMIAIFPATELGLKPEEHLIRNAGFEMEEYEQDCEYPLVRSGRRPFLES